MKETEQKDFIEIFDKKYRSFAKEVIENRALIESRDGLKPVQRRILWSMFENRIFPTGNTIKVSRVVGNVMGGLHPHGDSSIEDALVRLAQDFSLRVPLLIPQGNFGDADDPSAHAAARYIEAKLSQAGMLLLEDTSLENVEFIDNYDCSCQEPTILASKFPNVLINGGGSGMAVGIAFRDVSHNPNEVCDAIKLFIEKPESTIDDLLKVMPGPDWNCGGYVFKTDGIRDYMSSGSGKIIVQAKASVEENKNKSKIVISELPHQFGSSQFMQQLAELIKNDKSEIISSSISKFKDLSDSKNGTNIIIELKNGSSPKLVLEEIYSKTGLKQSININLNILNNKTPKKYSIIELIKEYISHRRNIITNRTLSKNKILEKNLIKLDALIKAILKIDNVIKTIKNSENYDDASNKLQKLLNVDENQSKIILEIPLKRLTKLEINDLNIEIEKTKKEIENNNSILSDISNIDQIIIEDLKQIKKVCGSQRKTQFINETETIIDSKKLINEEKLCFMTTFDNKFKFVKHFNNNLSEKEKNTISKIEQCSNLNKLMILDKDGNYISKNIHDLEITTRNSNGLTFKEIENINDYLIVSDENNFLSTMTDDGKIKKSILSEYSVSNKKMPYIKVKKQTINSIIHDDSKEYLIITDKGYAIRYDSNLVSQTARMTQGVKGLSPTAGNPIKLLSVATDDERFLILMTANGYGKKIALSNIQSSASRGGKGLIVFKTNETTGCVASATIATEESPILAITTMGATARLFAKDIQLSNRNNKGHSLIDMIMGQTISRIDAVL